jgi:hypothetical protein
MNAMLNCLLPSRIKLDGVVDLVAKEGVTLLRIKAAEASCTCKYNVPVEESKAFLCTTRCH